MCLVNLIGPVDMFLLSPNSFVEPNDSLALASVRSRYAALPILFDLVNGFFGDT